MENGISRRDVIVGASAAATVGVISHFLGSEVFGQPPKEGPGMFMHKLPPLPYPEDALEPVIDKQTVNIHYGKHFAGYVEGLNATLQKIEEARKSGKFDAIK